MREIEKLFRDMQENIALFEILVKHVELKTKRIPSRGGNAFERTNMDHTSNFGYLSLPSEPATLYNDYPTCSKRPWRLEHVW